MTLHASQDAELAAELHGKTLTIPNLWPIFQHWPRAVNENLHRLRQNTNKILERTIQDSKLSKLEALKSCDFALLTSCLFPQARWEELEISGIFMLWIFLWDDEIDEGSSEVAQNKVHAEAYVQESMEYARLNLGLTYINGSNGESEHNGDMVESSIDLSASCSVTTMTYFRDACPALRGYLDEGLIIPTFFYLGKMN
ncbi:terpene synthase family metal binding domain-containing protein [Penicillium malachiteum]|uniref:terpene synthase family metal binding domain-containing protein n=1 Tax=Penicillium malachiteum TaxID=1324776 RepID=UPI0025469807|nr:terpene synthase family metal binding domain-containing protein [Penicillium malachiteum]KAJ5726085.1 terpene synthase family metal binding domain-containing protein [Penicillium malachiteum]